MLVLASVWFLLQFLNEQNTRKKTNFYFWIWGVSNLCLVYTHWFSWFFVGIQLFLVFLYYKPLRKKVVFSFAFLMLGFLPATIRLFSWFIKLASEGTFLEPPRWNDFFGTLSFFFNSTRGFAMIALFICVVALFLAMKKKEKKFQILCLNIGIPFALMFLISFKYPMWVPRYVIFAGVGFIQIYVISLFKIYDILKTLRMKIIWVIFAIGLTGIYFASFTADHRRFPIFFDHSGAVEFIRKHEQKPFVFATTNWDGGIVYTYHRPLFENINSSIVGEYDNFHFFLLWSDEHLQAIRELNLNQVIVFGNRLFDEDIKPLLDSLAKDLPYQKTKFFAPHNHVKIFQKNEFSQP